MPSVWTTPHRAAAAGFDRPLLLTPRQDLVGFISGKLGQGILFLTSATSVVAVFLIFAFIIREAWPFVAKFGIRDLLNSTRWYPEAEQPQFGMLALIAGSFYVTGGAVLVAAPLGLLTAAFLSDIVPFGVRQVVKPVIEILAAIPSVAYGFFAVLVLAPFLQSRFGLSTGANALNASIILAIMAVPTIVSVSEDSMMAVGRELREASYALGATRADTILKTVFPAARNGIVAATILGIMRAVGETMVVWMASGNASQIPSPWWNLTEPVRTMTATIAGDMGETVKGSDHYRALFTVGLFLLVLTFILNAVTEFFLDRTKREAGGMKL
jgi:phosphate transport system permease protein